MATKQACTIGGIDVFFNTQETFDNRVLIDKTEPKDGAMAPHYDQVTSVSMYVRIASGEFVRLDMMPKDLRRVVEAMREIETPQHDAQYTSLPF